MKHASALLVAVLLLSSCALPATIWTKAAGTQGDFNRDTYECERDARSAANVGEAGDKAITMKGFYERCMQARGYIKKGDAPNFRPKGSAPGVFQIDGN